MKPGVQKFLDEQFEKGKNFLIAQEALLNELVITFQGELWDSLEGQSFFRLGQKMALPLQPDLQKVIARQVLFAWGLGFAVGSASVKKSPRESGE